MAIKKKIHFQTNTGQDTHCVLLFALSLAQLLANMFRRYQAKFASTSYRVTRTTRLPPVYYIVFILSWFIKARLVESSQYLSYSSRLK